MGTICYCCKENEERALAAERELERWRHGKQVEGDYVCPHEARAEELTREVERREEMLRASAPEVIAEHTRDLQEKLHAAESRASSLQLDVGTLTVEKEAYYEQKCEAEKALAEEREQRELAWQKLDMSEARERAAEADAARLRDELGRWARIVGDFQGGHGGASDADKADAVLLAFARAALSPSPPPAPEPRPYHGGTCLHCGTVPCTCHKTKPEDAPEPRVGLGPGQVATGLPGIVFERAVEPDPEVRLPCGCMDGAGHHTCKTYPYPPEPRASVAVPTFLPCAKCGHEWRPYPVVTVGIEPRAPGLLTREEVERVREWVRRSAKESRWALLAILDAALEWR